MPLAKIRVVMMLQELMCRTNQLNILFVSILRNINRSAGTNRSSMINVLLPAPQSIALLDNTTSQFHTKDDQLYATDF